MEDRNQELLRQYNIKIYNTYRNRGALILETDSGLKLFKNLDGSKNRVEFENVILQHLSLRNYDYTDLYVMNNQGQIVTEDSQGVRCVIKNWYPGDECNLRDEGDVYECTLNLALLHSLLRDVEYDKEQLEFSNNTDLSEIFEKRNRELKRVRSYIREKRKKNDFELCYLNYYDKFYEQALSATKLLGEVNYKPLQERANRENHICHGNYTYHNIIKIAHQQSVNQFSENPNIKILQPEKILQAAAYSSARKSKVATTNFEKAYVGVQVMDLYHFMRKVLEKNDWDIDLGSMILDTYESLLPLSKDELKLLHVLFLYPEKFWKISNFYYNSKKSWVPQRNIQKLINIQEQMESKNEFLECLIGSIN